MIFLFAFVQIIECGPDNPKELVEALAHVALGSETLSTESAMLDQVLMLKQPDYIQFVLAAGCEGTKPYIT